MKLIKKLGLQYATKTSPCKRQYGIFSCPKCETEYRLPITHISKEGKMCRSCTCSKRLIKHGDSGTRLHRIWNAMKTRCSNKRQKSYTNYGGRGICVCEEWLDYEVFSKWSRKNGYADELTIDRINNDGNYEPSNCRWTTRLVQARNTRRLRKDNTSGYRGVVYYKTNKRWGSCISVDNKIVTIGYYSNKIDAAKGYDSYIIDNNLEHTRNFS